MAPDDGHAAFLLPGLGHNRGPLLDEGAGTDWEGADWRLFCWRKAYRAAWKTPPREIALARLARAEALGISYREYAAVILDRGLHP